LTKRYFMQINKDVKTPWMSDEFWVSPYNFEEIITKRPDMPPKIIIHDTTLRDGEQTPGVIFLPEEKITIAKMLDEIGVDRIEAGMPAVSLDNREAIQAIAGLGLAAEVYCSCPAGGKESDVDLAVSWGVDGILTSVPVGVPRLKYQHPNWTEDHIINMAIRSISYAKSRGVKVTFICMEASRSERPFLERLLESVSKNSLPDSVALYDTAGCLIPASAALMVKLVKEVTGLPVEVHYHNDLGFGLANTLAAIEAGAEIVHVTVNGLGERGGNVSLDELAIALHCLYGVETKIDYPRLTEISKLVERLSEIPLSRSKPIVSDGVYCRES
jgi:isopropylmalate/homocitrate/citramalate synthase